jgi:hypothetical protein
MARTVILTPYQATKVMNQHRAQLGLKPVQSPFMYIQARKGRFPVVRSDDGRWEIQDAESFARWAYEHNTRQARRASQRDGHQDLVQLAIEA